MTSYRVAEGTQVNVEGTVHPAGAVVELDPVTADWALLAGIVTPTPKRKTAKGQSADIT